MRELTAAVIAKGYKRLVFVGPLRVSPKKINLYEVEERYAGFVEAVDAAENLERRLVAGNDFIEEIRTIDLKGTRTAILCCSDIFALEILDDFRHRGLSVPTDVGLSGFDSINALRYITPRLTTVEYPTQQMGEIAFSLLVANPREEASIPLIELKPKIIWGDSI
jgi:LacI family transcriptional regulator